ncbi:unnamed protein product [Candidula unifasciata]|uniref:Delta-like protein n=1 Tax=Candidula unifasciata TaxID=100452 RepID=A0A8S3YPD8_9EUPU|nr:unnamed protein product [Candidula unifasciata]
MKYLLFALIAEVSLLFESQKNERILDVIYRDIGYSRLCLRMGNRAISLVTCSKFCRPRDDLLGHYRCTQTGQQVCLDGWRGVDCTEALCSERCAPSRGTCTSPHTCSCRQGWYGEHCDKCRTYPGCKHGTCHLPGQCVCHKGWAGPLCDVEELFCLEHKPCQNGGTCLHDAFFNYTCNCPSGFTGTHCEVPLCHHNFCLHGGSCQIAEGTRYCLCPEQFTGPRCQHRLIHSVSSLPQSSSSCSGASCTPKPHKQSACQEHQCYNNGNCTEIDDSESVQCLCPFPFTGPQCLQVHDPCKTIDTFTGSFVCDCDSGYFGNVCGHAMLALKKTVCDENVICENGGTCEKWQRSGQYFCKCLAEFTGEFCELEKGDGCSLHTCLNGGTCVMNSNNEPTCACEKGYSGLFCEDLTTSLCSRVVCQNGGTCLELDGQFVCACRRKFEGIFCEKRVRRRETTIIVVGSTAVQNERLKVKDEGTFKSNGVPRKTNVWSILSASLLIWIIYHVIS